MICWWARGSESPRSAVDSASFELEGVLEFHSSLSRYEVKTFASETESRDLSGGGRNIRVGIRSVLADTVKSN